MSDAIERMAALAGVPGSEMDETVRPESQLDDDELVLFNRIVLSAVNDGRFYKKRDAQGAVKAATKIVLDALVRELRSNSQAVQKLAAQEVRRRWG